MLGGVSLQPSPSSAPDGVASALSAVGDDTTIEGCIDDAEVSGAATVPGGAAVAVTHAAVHVLPDGADTDPDEVESVPLSSVTGARTDGLLRQELTVDLGEESYLVQPDQRRDLDGMAEFCRRASWSWRRVTPRLETVREAVADLEDGDLDPETADHRYQRATLALSNARGSAARLDTATDAIGREIDRLTRALNEQRVAWLRDRAGHQHDVARRRAESGTPVDAVAAYESARDRYREALSIALDRESDAVADIERSLESVRESLYALESDVTVAAHEACTRARTAEDPETAREAWQAAREQYRTALSAADPPLSDDTLRFQLTWVEANLVRACRREAEGLVADADDYAAEGHTQWARQLYMAAHDRLSTALSVAEANDHLDAEPVADHRQRVAADRPEPTDATAESSAD